MSSFKKAGPNGEMLPPINRTPSPPPRESLSPSPPPHARQTSASPTPINRFTTGAGLLEASPDPDEFAPERLRQLMHQKRALEEEKRQERIVRRQQDEAWRAEEEGRKKDAELLLNVSRIRSPNSTTKKLRSVVYDDKSKSNMKDHQTPENARKRRRPNSENNNLPAGATPVDVVRQQKDAERTKHGSDKRQKVGSNHSQSAIKAPSAEQSPVASTNISQTIEAELPGVPQYQDGFKSSRSQLRQRSLPPVQVPSVFKRVENSRTRTRRSSASPTVPNIHPTLKVLDKNPVTQDQNVTIKHEEHEEPRKQASKCPACSQTSKTTDSDENDNVLWIECHGCRQWFHLGCVGLTEENVESIDKYSCPKCSYTHGATTYVRKSSRAHASIDYAGLNEGVIKPAKADVHHPYVKLFLDNNIDTNEEHFPRMFPEMITQDFFEKGNGWKEPILVPAKLNPQRDIVFSGTEPPQGFNPHPEWSLLSTLGNDERRAEHTTFELVQDDGQDGLGMFIPRHLTVRQVADLYGPSEKVPVIDVKSQGEAGSWTLAKFADYYEQPGKKAVKNVISLEVSDTRLGRLIKRPTFVRDLDLIDRVWPKSLKERGEYPRTRLYCLMSVANSYTDFHIDFGGSSVFYHIISGKKTFLFIPPEKKNLKKYEQWCNAPDQSTTFLPTLTNGCYRVDLSTGDTMLIPSGWIHAVWTPEDTIVIGGNFMTQMHYSMQFAINEIEKVTKTPRKFRMPHFQRIHWYAAMQYISEDPCPEEVKERLWEGGVFERDVPVWEEYDTSESDAKGPTFKNSRYYSKHELDGIPQLLDYVFSTACIAAGISVANKSFTAETRKAVKKSIPPISQGEPMDVVKNLAWWYAWKRGNETIPAWSHPETRYESVPEEAETKVTEKKQPTRVSKRKQAEKDMLSKETPEKSGPIKTGPVESPVKSSSKRKRGSDEDRIEERAATHETAVPAVKRPKTSDEITGSLRRKIEPGSEVTERSNQTQVNSEVMERNIDSVPTEMSPRVKREDHHHSPVNHETAEPDNTSITSVPLHKETEPKQLADLLSSIDEAEASMSRERAEAAEVDKRAQGCLICTDLQVRCYHDPEAPINCIKRLFPGSKRQEHRDRNIRLRRMNTPLTREQHAEIAASQLKRRKREINDKWAAEDVSEPTAKRFKRVGSEESPSDEDDTLVNGLKSRRPAR